MAFNSLTFDGINSLDYGIYITGESVYDVPKRDVEAVEIAGRNGDFLLDKGRWKNIEVTYRCGCFGSDQTEFANKIRTFRNLLASRTGYKRITDTYNTTEYRMGTLVNPVEVDSVSYKRAGEFDLTFNCKPQRYLTSGETASTVANNGTLTNPTAYDASPLLAVKGYGTITFNGYSIKIVNGTLGDVVLWDNTSATNASPVSIAKTINGAVMNSGNSFYCSPQISCTLYGLELVSIWQITDSTSYATTTAAVVNPYPMGVNNSASIRIRFANVPFVYGTASTVSNTTGVNIAGTNSELTTATINTSLVYDGANTVTISVSGYGTPPYPGQQADLSPILLMSGAGEGVSTVSAQGNPTYIDCEIGEAYMIRNSTTISLNRYIDLGSDLPTLKSGTNTFTKTNTITELKVTPRWWQL